MIDWKGEKILQKFYESQFEIHSIRFDSTSKLRMPQNKSAIF